MGLGGKLDRVIWLVLKLYISGRHNGVLGYVWLDGDLLLIVP